MEIIGGQLRMYPPDDEGSHPFGADEWWQESVFVLWYDVVAGVGGMHRIGHEPHQNGGSAVLYNYLFVGDGVLYKNTQVMPLRAEDRYPNGLGAGPTCRYEHIGKPVLTFEDEQVAGRLEFEDDHTPIDVFPESAGTLADDFAKNHYEVSGRVRGTVRVGARRFDVDSLGYRDHSWGVRDWSAMLTHRWVAGVIDSSLSFCALSWLGGNGTVRKFGYVRQGQKVINASEVDILTAVEVDGLTHRGGIVNMTLVDGQELEIVARPLVKGIASFHHDVVCYDNLCQVTLNGQSGICDFETSNNSMAGTKKPAGLINGVIDNGYYTDALPMTRPVLK
ncbi:hypothetical protein ABT124_41760 [Streptomyces sp. NPDC001982]|uniref:DUF7065 domain-containing protein n=1 Tax=Streptomyces sp. NPDC001982 TaxID=3154405 RepID=UPI0033302452